METLYQLLKTLTNIIPDNSEETVETDDFKLRVINKDNCKGFEFMASLKEESEEPSALDKTKVQIAEFKELMASLDDTTFVDVLEKISETIDINEFNNLLDKEDLTLSEGLTATWLIRMAKKTIETYVNQQIEKLQEIKEKL